MHNKEEEWIDAYSDLLLELVSKSASTKGAVTDDSHHSRVSVGSSYLN